MLKFFLITFLVFYLLFRFGGFLFRLLFGISSPKSRSYSESNGKSRSGNTKEDVNIDYIPKDKRDSNGKYRGGDYIDYEEVK